MNEYQAREKLNIIAAASFQANISNPDAMQMDNGYFIDMHIRQIKKQSHGDWNWKLAGNYIDHLDGMMRRD